MKLSLFCFRWGKTTKVLIRDRTLTHQAEAEFKEVGEEVREDEAEKMNDPNIEEVTSTRLEDPDKTAGKETDPDHLLDPLINQRKGNLTLTVPTPVDLTRDPLTNPDTQVHPDTLGPDDINTKSGLTPA